jgi:ribosomal protein S18 acetylase RimI-like enzyme
MPEHPLDNPVWTALTTLQAHWAVIAPHARKFRPEIGPIAALDAPTREAYDSLASLEAEGEAAAFLLFDPPQVPAGWKLIEDVPLLQMLLDDSPIPPPAHEYIELSTADAPEMLALATLTKPGPFALRTHELGRYIGIRREGRLAAMAGIRLCVPGYTEVSAVCTHPDFLGNGYARSLIAVLVDEIRSRGERPFLHVRQENTRAADLYRRMGFRDRVTYHLTVLVKSSASSRPAQA